MDRYIVDFVSYEHKVIIEIDGSDHDSTKDAERDKFFSTQGFQVLRFTNSQVMQSIQTILDAIYIAIHPSPSHHINVV